MKAQKTQKLQKKSSKSKPGDNNAGVTTYEQIFQWFEAYIENNGIKTGDPLPSEDDIMQETKMSRSSVREAITRLRALGIVDTRRKRGMWLVRSPKLLDLVRLLNSTQIPQDQMGHVGGYRCAMELGFWSEIYSNATPDGIAELRAIYEKMVENGNTPGVWNDYDRKFHLKLISFARNNIAIWLSQLLNPFFKTLSVYVPPLSEYVRVLHEAIVVALEERNSEAFYHALHEHNFWKLAADRYDWAIPKIMFNQKASVGAQNKQGDSQS